MIGEQITDALTQAGPAITDGLVVERRGVDRRRNDWLTH